MTKSSQSAVKAEDPLPVILGHAMLSCCYCRETHSPWVWGRQQPVLFCFARFNLGYPQNTVTGKSSPFVKGTIFSEKKHPQEQAIFPHIFFLLWLHNIWFCELFHLSDHYEHSTITTTKSMTDSEAKLIMPGMLCCFCKALTDQQCTSHPHT